MSRVMPYVPTHLPPVATAEDIAAMKAKLARRVQISVNGGSGERVPSSPCALPDGAKPAPTPAAKIEWQPPRKLGDGSWVLKSMCQRYRIDKLIAKSETTYTCWRIEPGELNQRLGLKHKADEAIALCQASADIVGGKP